MDSDTLQDIDVRLMGRLFPGSCLLLFLKMRVINARFQSVGKVLHYNDLQKTSVSGLTTQGTATKLRWPSYRVE